ncbi:MAG: TIM barrel protein, partial [Spirochaetales bacterium]
MKPSICIEMLYTDLPFEKRLERIQEQGFPYIEFWSWKDKDAVRFSKALNRLGIKVSNYSGQRKGDLLRLDQHAIVEADFQEALRFNTYYQSPVLMVLAQELGAEGRVVRPVTKEAGPVEIRTIAEGIKKLLSLAAMENPDTTPVVVFEPLNTRLDHSGYAVSKMDTAAQICQEVNHPRFGLLLDLYHMAMMGESLEECIRRYADLIRYVHVADVPGRG